MDKSKPTKKSARIIWTNQTTPTAARKSWKKGRQNVKDYNQFNSTYHDLAMEETPNRDLRASSSSSLSLSFFSESDLAEAPSTSGCSSEMASMMHSKERKKEKAKEFMKKLKSMLPVKQRMAKKDTLSTLEQVVNNMRRLSEFQKKEGEFKTPHHYLEMFYSVDADNLLQSDMYVTVSLKNHIVQRASSALMTELGYPAAWWKGRFLCDFLSKQDINTVNRCLAAQDSKEEHEASKASGASSMSHSSANANVKEGDKYLFARIRRFRKLTYGFSMQNAISYCPFVLTVTTAKPYEATTNLKEDKEAISKFRKSLILYFRPLTSAYTDSYNLPVERRFSLCHSSSCKYTNVEPNAIPLLGHLPQDFNGKSIFDLYHPDDFRMLLEIHKRIVQSVGEPFKTDRIRLKTCNGCYIELETEWSCFINPWSMRLELIIGQHTVIKGPSRPDVFEDLPSMHHSPDRQELSPELCKIQEEILEVLQKPIQDVFTQPGPRAPIKELGTLKRNVSQTEGSESAVKPAKEKPKVPFNPQDVGEKYTILDDKGISSIYNQLNYSHNIKRFLLSHPKPFTNVSDEDSIPARNEDDPMHAMHADEEMSLEIPVVKPSSCGSSTQVHVSEQGNGEEMFSFPVTVPGDEGMMPSREVKADNICGLTKDSLKKHTKMQELLYLQKIADEQPLLLNMRRKTKINCQNSPQKRPWPHEPDEEVDKAKHPCPVSGIFRSSSNIFMQSFPSLPSCAPTPTTYKNHVYTQSSLMVPFNTQGVMVDQQAGLFNTLPIASLNPIPLVQVRQAMAPMVPRAQPIVVTSGHQTHHQACRTPPIVAGLQPQNIQWPYYPQPGYTLMPQVMGGFYQPILQPVKVEKPTPPPADRKPDTTVQTANIEIPQLNSADKKEEITSGDDTGSSIMYLLEADSSINEDKKGIAVAGTSSKAGTLHKHKHKPSVEPPWLRGIKWNTTTKMRYQVTQPRLNPCLKKDKMMLKKCQLGGDLALESLVQLMEEISLPSNIETFDEEFDYMFFPNDETNSEDRHLMEDNFTEIELTMGDFMKEGKEASGEGGKRRGEDKGGGGGGEDEENAIIVIGEEEDAEHQHESEGAGGEERRAGEEDEEEKHAILAETSTGKGDKELDPLSDEGNATGEESNKTADIESAAIETAAMFMPSAEVDKLDMNRISPKGGSLSGDEGSATSSSDVAIKQEMEDSQSNSSKLSSNITPSVDRSNGEAGSSHKESNASEKYLKFHSPRSSPGPCSQEDEEGLDGTAIREQCGDMFKKLFIPLKVQVCQKPDVPPSLPFWLANAQMSPKVSMTYQLPTRLLEDVLLEDRKKLENFRQSNTTKQQLLHLLTDSYPKVTPSPRAPKPEFEASTSRKITPSTSQLTSEATRVVSENSSDRKAPPVNPDGKTVKMEISPSAGDDAESKIDSSLQDGKISHVKESDTKPGDVLALSKQPSSSLLCNIKRTQLSAGKKGKALISSGSYSDPKVCDSIPDSSGSCCSSLSGLMLDKQTSSSPPTMSPTTADNLEIDVFFKDCFCADLGLPFGMSIEDIIMSKVFVADTGIINRAMKNIFSLSE